MVKNLVQKIICLAAAAAVCGGNDGAQNVSDSKLFAIEAKVKRACDTSSPLLIKNK